MATNSSSSAADSGGTPTARRTAATSARRSSAGTHGAASTGTRRSTGGSATSTKPKTRVDQVQHMAERAVLVPVGASLLAQENVVSTVRGLATRYRTRAGLERELKRFERRGATARNRFERQVRKTRTRFERELRQRRTTVERSVKQNRRRLEREVRLVRKDPAGAVSTRAARLIANAQELISSAP